MHSRNLLILFSSFSMLSLSCILLLPARLTVNSFVMKIFGLYNTVSWEFVQVAVTGICPAAYTISCYKFTPYPSKISGFMGLLTILDSVNRKKS